MFKLPADQRSSNASTVGNKEAVDRCLKYGKHEPEPECLITLKGPTAQGDR